MATIKGYAVGSTVALTEEYVSLFEAFDLRNVICEVVDSRGANGETAYVVAPVAPVGVDWSRAREVFGADLRAVRS